MLPPCWSADGGCPGPARRLRCGPGHVLALHSPEAEARARFIADRLFVLASTAALARSAPPGSPRLMRGPASATRPDDRRATISGRP